MAKTRLDLDLVERKLVSTRSQAESYIRLGKVKVNGRIVQKPGTIIDDQAAVKLEVGEQYVSRAALKLASVAEQLGIDFKGRTVLDVGSSTGGFTDYALRRGAKRVIAVDVGSEQLHPTLRSNPKIELHEKTDIRDVRLRLSNEGTNKGGAVYIASSPDIVLADVSFISLKAILPAVKSLCTPKTSLLVMLKPQFEADKQSVKHRGVIKNDHMRRQIIKDFEGWLTSHFIILAKADSGVLGAKGNRERFYLLRTLS